MLQDSSQNFIQGAILIRESVHLNRVKLRIIAHVVRLDRIEPMAHAVFARLNQESEIGRVVRQQVVEQLSLLVTRRGYPRQPFVNGCDFVSEEIFRRRHAGAIDQKIPDV